MEYQEYNPHMATKIDDYQAEFDRQVQTYVQKDFPALAGISNEAFLAELSLLRGKVSEIPSDISITEGILPFVIVINSNLVPVEKSVETIERKGKKGYVNLDPVTPKDFTPITSVIIPKSPFYLLINIDRGKNTLNVRPEDALKRIEKEKRSPLTIDEGISILVHYPEYLKKNNCFSLLASRRNDQRVPALWISKTGPRLGWCWDRNPHTWLGSASCEKRIGISE